MADDSKTNWARKVWELVEIGSLLDSGLRHFGGGHINLFGKKKKDEEPGVEQLHEGGESDWTDERRFSLLVERLSARYRAHIEGYIPFEFKISASDIFERAKARQALEEFRVFVVGMDVTPAKTGDATSKFSFVDPSNPANTISFEWNGPTYANSTDRGLTFLRGLARRIENSPDTAAGYAAVSAYLRAMGLPHMPDPDETTLYDRVRTAWNGRHRAVARVAGATRAHRTRLNMRASKEGVIKRTLRMLADKL